VKELKFKDTIQFGVWKFLVNVDDVIKPHFACAQPIPIGVRIGEDHQTITEVGVCSVNPPDISCVGASEKMNFGSFGGYWNMELNGVFYPSSTDLLQNYITNHFSDKIYADYDGFMYFGNLSPNNHRIRLIPTIGARYSNAYGNDTFMENEDGSLTFCLAKKCDPNTLEMHEGGLAVAGTVTIQYKVDAPNHGVNEVATFQVVDYPVGTELSVLVRMMINDLIALYPFINISTTTGGGNGINFDLWSYDSGQTGKFRLSGVNAELSSDPITITFIRTMLEGDIYNQLFPNAVVNEMVAHSCGTATLIGI